jgi:HAD superfamily hydrolase (TIGR01509 family)
MGSVGIRNGPASGEKSEIRAVVLDIDGTLCSLTNGVGTIYHDLLRERGLVSDSSTLEHAARQVWAGFQETYLNTQDLYRTTHTREREVWLEFVRRVCAAAQLPHGTDDAVVEFIYDAFASRAYRRVEPGAIDFLRRAHARGLILAAASNNDSRSKVMVRELGLDAYLSQVLVAGDLGWKKPSPNFYDALSARIAVPPANILHVGNDRALDVEAAMRRGFSAVLYAPKGGTPSPSVASFSELGDMLGL